MAHPLPPYKSLWISCYYGNHVLDLAHWYWYKFESQPELLSESLTNQNAEFSVAVGMTLNSSVSGVQWPEVSFLVGLECRTGQEVTHPQWPLYRSRPESKPGCLKLKMLPLSITQRCLLCLFLQWSVLLVVLLPSCHPLDSDRDFYKLFPRKMQTVNLLYSHKPETVSDKSTVTLQTRLLINTTSLYFIKHWSN